MSKSLDEAMKLAEREAKYTKRAVAVLMDEQGRYDLVFADEYMDDPEVVYIAPGRKRPIDALPVLEDCMLDKDDVDDTIELLQMLFARSPRRHAYH